MRTTGVVRRIDDLGRVVIPKEIRKLMRIKEGDPLEIFIDNNKSFICFQKFDIQENYLLDLKNIADSIADHYWSPENSDNLKIINMAIHEIELQLKAITEREE